MNLPCDLISELMRPSLTESKRCPQEASLRVSYPIVLRSPRQTYTKIQFQVLIQLWSSSLGRVSIAVKAFCRRVRCPGLSLAELTFS